MKKSNQEQNTAETQKQNQDLPNIPAASEEIKKPEQAKKEIKQTSVLQEKNKQINKE